MASLPDTASLLTRPEHDNQPMRFDRRRSPRRAAAGHVTLLRRSHETTVYRHPVCSIHLCDLSDHGIGAHSDLPLHPDEPVAVFLPPHGSERGVDLIGHIARVEPDATSGYRIGIAFDPRPAA